MAFLYINAKGQPWRKHSYTAGNVFDQNPFKYKLQKIYGWKEKNARARFEFGKCFESAIQWYHDNGGDLNGTLVYFRTQWMGFKDQPLEYTKVEKDWATCARIATDWLRLYAIRQPKLPIPLGGATVFQRMYEKEVFPGDPNYGEIFDGGKLDIVAYVDPSHPMLPVLAWKPEYGAFRPVIVDIKTAGTDFHEQYGMAAFDAQLRRYSWLSGIRDVALLWFVKKGLTIEKGYSVTLLEDVGYMKAGDEAVVALVVDTGVWLVANDFVIEEMEKAQGKKPNKKGEVRTDQTEEAKARRDAWLKANGTFVIEAQITKQRLQFNAGYVSIESAEDAGKIAAQQIISIVNAWHTQNYPDKSGVRYPHDDSSDPYFRAFVLNDKMYRNQNFKKTEEVNIFDEDEEAGD
jgi:hypothetical protein